APQDFTAADLSRIAQGVDPANLDRSATILDYMKLAADSQVIVSEPDEVEANAMKLVEQLRQSYEEALHRKQRSLAPTDLFASWNDLAAHLDHGTRLTTLGVDASLAEDASPSVSTGTHIRCQPAVPLHGRVADWVAEIRKLREAGDTTVFVAATSGRAERTVEILKEYEVLAVPVERADDARYASVLVAVGALTH